jgi:hypothetical protein
LPVYPVGNPYSQTFLIFIQNRYYQLYDCIGIKKFFSLRKLTQWIIMVEQAFEPKALDCRLKPDNNAAENAIRPFVLGSKNWLMPVGIQMVRKL